MLKNIQLTSATGTAHTNSTDEAVLASCTFAANHFQVGKRYRFIGAVNVSSTNSTDTLTVKVRLGGTTLTGTIIATTAAIDVADNDTCVVHGEFVVTAVSATAGAVKAVSFTGGPDAAGVATGSGGYVAVSSLNTAAALLLELTADWSAASASDICAAELFIVDEIA